jgi:hypothetical protein
VAKEFAELSEINTCAALLNELVPNETLEYNAGVLDKMALQQLHVFQFACGSFKKRRNAATKIRLTRRFVEKLPKHFPSGLCERFRHLGARTTGLSFPRMSTDIGTRHTN